MPATEASDSNVWRSLAAATNDPGMSGFGSPADEINDSVRVPYFVLKAPGPVVDHVFAPRLHTTEISSVDAVAIVCTPA